MIRRSVLAAATLLAAAPLVAATYTFEPEHTQGVVRWNHLGFANPTAQFNNRARSNSIRPIRRARP